MVLVRVERDLVEEALEVVREGEQLLAEDARRPREDARVVAEQGDVRLLVRLPPRAVVAEATQVGRLVDRDELDRVVAEGERLAPQRAAVS